MVKTSNLIKIVLVLLFFYTNLVASSSVYYSKVDALTYKIKNAPHHEAIKSYNSLKNLYLKTLISGNKQLQKKVLIALVGGGKRVGMSTYSYQKKLDLLTKTDIKRYKKSSKKVKKREIKAVSSKRNMLKSVKIKKDSIVLYFTHYLKIKNINHFVLKMYNPKKYVYDVIAKMYKNTDKYTISNHTSIKIGAFAKDKTRIVLISKKNIKPRIYIDKNRLTIKLNFQKPNTSKNRKKTYKKSPLKQTKNTRIIKITNKTVVIDAGHGGKDSGAIGSKKRYEKAAVLAVAKKIAQKLRTKGYRVYLTRDRDKFIKLKSRTHLANKKHAHIFVSIHANAVAGRYRKSKAHGIETYFLSPAKSKRAKSVALLENRNDVEAMAYQSKQTYLNFISNSNRIASNKLAIDVQRGMKQELSRNYKNIHDGGVREGPFWVLVGAQMPSILVEIGYITHPVEGKRLFNKTYQNRLANGISNGIINYFQKN